MGMNSGRGFRLLAGSPHAPFWADVPDFQPRWPWIGGDLQTLRNRLVAPPKALWGVERRLLIPLRSPSFGALSALSNAPFDLAKAKQEKLGASPIVLMVHGLGGCEDSAYLRLATLGFEGCGVEVIRLNLRGAGPSAASSSGPYHGGLTDDLCDVLAWLHAERPGQPVLAIGFSLGGHMLLRLAGQLGAGEIELEAAHPLAIMSISAPLDLAAAGARIAAPRNRIYHQALLRWMKRDGAQWAPSDDDLQMRLRAVASIRDFDDRIVAPAHGFRNADDYYYRASAAHGLSRIRLPVLALHGDDDPWIPLDAYQAADWPDGGHVQVAISRGGGHVGFHGRQGILPWYVMVTRKCVLAHISGARPGMAVF
ncbi:putative esterase YheT [alpha proteobacterium Q-1]|nr:putative esterase YheT [alpha proteobacterium Q-1]